jgi:peptidoglycan/xylan/chitin deacetylase (PgdA/CDA1 family)
MAMNLQREGNAALRLPLTASPSNDGFAFWKLPEAWREPLRESIEQSRRGAEHLLFERYLAEPERRPPAALNAYYRVKGLIPNPLRYRLNSLAIRSRRQREFPHWPCEDALVRYWREWLGQALAAVNEKTAWHIGLWPEGKRCAVVLTHDVESARGLADMEKIAALEESLGFRSAWNLALDQYPIDWECVARLRARGFEFGAHGLRHDGRLFRSREDFETLKPRVERLAHAHNLRGFRAPSTLRKAEWIASLDFDFDSSFADSDPYEPQPGGTCSLFPFFLADLVELPYTLAQDHTLIHLLHRSPLPLWIAKADWIASLSGMILTLTHPDYCAAPPYFEAYEKLLHHLAGLQQAWRALPSQVADWWRRRAAMQLTMEQDGPRLSGADTRGAVIRQLSEEPLAT